MNINSGKDKSMLEKIMDVKTEEQSFNPFFSKNSQDKIILPAIPFLQNEICQN